MKSINDASKSLMESVISHPKTALAVPTATAMMGTVSIAAEIQGWLTVFSMFLGCIISIILLRHRWVSLQTAEILKKEAQERLDKVTNYDK